MACYEPGGGRSKRHSIRRHLQLAGGAPSDTPIVGMSASNPSGQIAIEDDTVVYSLPGGTGWRVPVAGLRVVGEYTDCEGPYVDDYFLVFIASDEWFEASFYADGRDRFLADLGNLLDHELRLGLQCSTSVASRVMWPARLEGQPLFDLFPEERAMTVLRRLGQRVAPRVDLHFTVEVRREFES